MKLDFHDDTGLQVTIVFGKLGLGPDMDTLAGRILNRRRVALSSEPSGPQKANSLQACGYHDVATTLEKLASLRDNGVLTEDEFQKKKSEILSRL